MDYENKACTTMGLLTLCVPSSHTKEADTTVLPISPSTFTLNDNFCPSDVKDKTLGSTWIFSAFEPVTVARYVDTGVPTFVTVLVKLRLNDCKGNGARANEGKFKSQTVPVVALVHVLFSPVISRNIVVL